MKLIWALLSCTFLLAFTNVHAQDSLTVTFILSTPSQKGDSLVYITGDIEQLGYWDPGKVSMTNTGLSTHTKRISIAGPATIEYKYTLGCWEKECAGKSGNVMPNFKADIQTDTIIRDTVWAWTDKPSSNPIESTISGSAHYYRGMKGNGIRDRNVIVWLPPGYEEQQYSAYPVIYMHDGQNVFDAATSAFGIEWQVDEAIVNLAEAGEMQPLIAVGIYNTSDRSAEYLPGDTADAYMDFIIGKLKPFIDSAYRTIPGPESTLTCGASAGGLVSFMLAWEHPQVFSKAICMSPALKVRTIDYVKVVKEGPENKPKQFFYIYNGGRELEAELLPGIEEMIDVLNSKGYSAGRDYQFIVDPEGLHEEAAWAEQFPDAIKACMSKIKH
jgi:predicted alpha/beta superfamily hydrolase